VIVGGVRRPPSPLGKVLFSTAVLIVLMFIAELLLNDVSLPRALVVALVLGAIFAAVQSWSVRRRARS
jgi:hypothetical protein